MASRQSIQDPFIPPLPACADAAPVQNSEVHLGPQKIRVVRLEILAFEE